MLNGIYYRAFSSDVTFTLMSNKLYIYIYNVCLWNDLVIYMIIKNYIYIKMYIPSDFTYCNLSFWGSLPSLHSRKNSQLPTRRPGPPFTWFSGGFWPWNMGDLTKKTWDFIPPKGRFCWSKPAKWWDFTNRYWDITFRKLELNQEISRIKNRDSIWAEIGM